MRNLLLTAVPRPVFVTVVGTIVTSYAALCALMGPFVSQMYATTYPEHALLEEGRTREALLQQQLWAGLGMSVVCAAVALGGLAFLRLRTWGRVVIESLGWLFAAYIAGGTVFMIVQRWDRWFAPLFGWPPGPGTVVMIIINSGLSQSATTIERRIRTGRRKETAVPADKTQSQVGTAGA